MKSSQAHDADDQLQATAEILQVLTPRLMRWNETIWLLDLSLCESYWLAQAVVQGTDVLSLVRSHLNGMTQSLAVAALGDGVLRAAMAAHPWQALLLVGHMYERGLKGFVSVGGAFGQNLYREVSWSVFWQRADELSGHLQGRLQGKRFNAATFKKQSLQMQRAVGRLGLRAPWELRDLSELAMKRRFGALLSEIWRWSFYPSDDAESVLFFWRSFVLKARPQVTRHLDEALFDWNYLAPFLKEDFDRLCGLPTWHSGERVVSLEWRLVLHDLSSHCIPIRFRHPHPLHLERGAHTTALLQALYAFERSAPRQQVIRDTGDKQTRTELLPMPIAGWDLILTERLKIPARTIGLFGDQTSLVEDLLPARSSMVSEEVLSLLQLENKLPVPLESYVLKQDWLPEDSYCAHSLLDQMLREQATDSTLGEPALTALARKRPLFLYKQPAPLGSSSGSSVWQFSERTMAKWWQQKSRTDACDLQRDYYRMIDPENRCYWVFKDTGGHWYVHGIFG